MKVFIVGKGGSGKSTVSALLAKEISKNNYNVIVVDNDESNYGLHTFLGLELPKDLMYFFGGKEDLFEEADKIQSEIEIENLPDEYLSQRDNLGLLVVGKIKEYGEGCACPMNALSGEFLKSVSLREDDFLLTDMDAGIEHFGRKVEKGADLILMVVDPTRESIKLSEKISKFGEKIDKDVFYILNKVDDKSENVVLDSLNEEKVLGHVPADERIAEAGLKGEELNFELEGIRKTADFIINLHEDLT